jgi:hypothetical protein
MQSIYRLFIKVVKTISKETLNKTKEHIFSTKSQLTVIVIYIVKGINIVTTTNGKQYLVNIGKHTTVSTTTNFCQITR